MQGLGVSFLAGASNVHIGGTTVNAQKESATAKIRDVRDFLKAALVKKAQVDAFLDPSFGTWARFDPELGYIGADSMIRDGLDSAFSIYRYESTGQRRMINYPDRPCRLNAYGDSFTQCHQVSDGETWEEMLAAHFGEPIRNFGVGGYGVYQAYLRLVRTESTSLGAPYAILNIWGDDHHRSLMKCRWFNIAHYYDDEFKIIMFHGNPWRHVRINPENGELIENPNACPTPESLYKLCEMDSVMELFAGDLITQIWVAQIPGTDVDTKQMKSMADALGLKVNLDAKDERPQSASKLFDAMAWKASILIVKKLKKFVDERNKKLLVLLSYPDSEVEEACKGISRDDPSYLDWHPAPFRKALDEMGVKYVDSLPKHLEDFAAFRLTPNAYKHRYYIGHYNPKGNQFFAFAIKDALVDWLDPKPVAYRAGGRCISFENYF